MMHGFPRRIALLGSTGSIGRQTLDVVRAFPDHFTIVALAARNHVNLLAEQAREFHPPLIACDADEDDALDQLETLLPAAIRGADGLMAAATASEADIVVVATSGLAALRPTLAALGAGKDVATANKESLVIAGHLIMRGAAATGAAVLPIDSEHSAIWQCLRGENPASIRRLIITASGGPFRTTSVTEMASVTAEAALKHPTWVMGPKVTIDSATLMNKGLEMIEAHWLFNLPFSQIAVVLQPQSIVHSMVEFVDGSIKMQASLPTMHLPIQEALSHPQRLDSRDKHLLADLDWAGVGRLDFAALDHERFPCFELALDAGRRGGTYPAALVGADEAAVALFLRGEIGLLDIARQVRATLEHHEAIAEPDIDQALAAYAWGYEYCLATTHA